MAELKYEHIRNTELWEILERKSTEQSLGHDFVVAVEKVCGDALDLSQHIVRIFPTYTLHNDIHSAHVCKWMRLLLGVRAEELTAQEAALLLMAACCHDIGMSVSPEQEKRLRQPSFHGWKKHFEENPGDAAVFEEKKIITDEILRNYVRRNHHLRVREHLMLREWPEELLFGGIDQDVLELLCESHGTALSLDKLKSCKDYDLLLCAVLLRLADLLDYDSDRAPKILFRHMGLDKPKTQEEKLSALEQKKTGLGKFNSVIKDHVLEYRAVFKNLQEEKDVRDYLDWVTKELNHCADQLRQTASHWKTLPLPYKISTDRARRDGYAYGEFCMTMDQDKVIELLTGKDIYPDPGVFVRELLQNAIDAVLMRTKQDPTFRLEDGRISIDTWPAGAGDTWFRIRDNGTGMDERIITNYFLKVGRSYYTSEEFKAANRTAPGGAYTAISRFGIGILSCFMADQDNTELKVSTKRFGSDAANGIRLDVTGLHGYYYLAHEQKHPDYAASFLEMPSPDDDAHGYREEPGTTICVKTNLFRMGGSSSFVEMMDKYVQFPEVRVTYDGPDGHRDYPTQQELMAAVEAVNPGGDVKEYVHPFPAEQAQALREDFSIFRWTEEPALVMRYYPVDRLSDSADMTGVAVAVELRCPLAADPDQIDPADVARLKWEWNVAVGQKLSVMISLDGINSVMRNRYPQLRYMHSGETYTFPTAGNDSILSPSEQKVWDLLAGSLRAVGSENGHIAYHGVLAAQKDPLNYYSYRRTCAILLLRNSFLPDVNIARDQISRVSPEAACCHAMAVENLGPFSSANDLLDRESTLLLTQRRLWAVLKQHPGWLDRLNAQQHGKNGLDRLRYRGSVIEGMRLCVAKHDHAVRYDFNDRFGDFAISALPADEDLVDFPVSMFALPRKACDILVSRSWDSHVYNREHRFSRWLIDHRAALEEKVPAVYDTLIRAMMLRNNGKEIRDTVNAILTRLRGFDGNCFGIRDELFLTEEDFNNDILLHGRRRLV